MKYYQIVEWHGVYDVDIVEDEKDLTHDVDTFVNEETAWIELLARLSALTNEISHRMGYATGRLRTLKRKRNTLTDPPSKPDPGEN